MGKRGRKRRIKKDDKRPRWMPSEGSFQGASDDKGFRKNYNSDPPPARIRVPQQVTYANYKPFHSGSLAMKRGKMGDIPLGTRRAGTHILEVETDRHFQFKLELSNIEAIKNNLFWQWRSMDWSLVIYLHCPTKYDPNFRFVEIAMGIATMSEGFSTRERLYHAMYEGTLRWLRASPVVTLGGP